MRVVLDTNVLVAALLRPNGPPGRILRLWRKEQRFQLVSSNEILDEAQDVLGRPYFAARVSQSTRDRFLLVLARKSIIVTLRLPLTESAPDPNDDMVFATAREGRADYLVTGDRLLRDVGKLGPVLVVSPRELVEILGS